MRLMPGEGLASQALEQSRKPQPTQTVWAPGSMEWLAEQNKAS